MRVKCFVLSLMDPGKQHAAYDRWRLGKSSLAEMFGVVDNYCAKVLRATHCALVKLDSNYAKPAPVGSHSTPGNSGAAAR